MMWSVEVVGGGSDVMRSHHQLRPATTPACGRSGVLEDGTFVNHFLPHIVYGKSHDENFLLLSLTTIKFKHETKRRCLLCCSTHVVVIQSNKYNYTLLQSLTVSNREFISASVHFQFVIKNSDLGQMISQEL